MRQAAAATLLALAAPILGAQVSDELVERLNAADKAGRLEGLLQVQQMKHPPAVLLEPVAERLLDPVPEIRVEAAYAVFRMLVSLGCRPTAVSECTHFKGLPFTPPVAETHVSPRYPEEAVSSHTQGVVVLECLIGEDGSVSRIFANTGPSPLHKPAEQALSQWRYKPGRFRGQAVPFATLVTVTFSLQRS